MKKIVIDYEELMIEPTKQLEKIGITFFNSTENNKIVVVTENDKPYEIFRNQIIALITEKLLELEKKNIEVFLNKIQRVTKESKKMCEEIGIPIPQNKVRIKFINEVRKMKLDNFRLAESTFNPTKKEKTWKKRNITQYNNFMRTELLSIEKKENLSIPKNFNRLINNLTKNDEEKNNLLSWIANNMQTLEKSQTAYIIHGVQGSGKGLLETILTKIYSTDYKTRITKEATLKNKFNSVLKDKLFVCIDEVEISGKDTTDMMKDMITEKTISIEKKGQDIISNYPAYHNILITTNSNKPITIEDSDRRFNVLYCSKPINKPGENPSIFYKDLLGEIREIAQYLLSYDCSEYLDVVLENQDRKNLKEITEKEETTFAKAVLNKDMEYFESFSALHKIPINSQYSFFDRINNFWYKEQPTRNGVANRIPFSDLQKAFKIIYPDIKKIDTKIFTNILGEKGRKAVNGKSTLSVEINNTIIEKNENDFNFDFDFEKVDF